MIEAIEKNLQSGIELLECISDAQYSDTSVAPYYSSIGNHTRHVLDVFNCIFIGLESGNIDFSVRERNELAEKETEFGIVYYRSIIAKLKQLNKAEFTTLIQVTDNMGLGNETVNYTLAAVLMQAQSHAIHHFASIGYLIYQLKIEMPCSGFGFNPTTPKTVEKS